MTFAFQRRMQSLVATLFLIVVIFLSSRCLGQDDPTPVPGDAISQLQAKAARGDAGAMYDLGTHYQTGTLIERDLQLGRQWLEKSANAGNARAINYLCCMYLNANGGVARDFSMAFHWAEKGSSTGAPSGLLDLGYLYDNGYGTVKNSDRAKKLYSQALEAARRDANAGDDSAMEVLASIYRDGLGVVWDYQQAMKWYREAAAAGDDWAMDQIGLMYARGEGVDRDHERAMIWFRKAANSGNPSAMNHIGDLYKEGLGVEQNLGEALSWYQRSVSAGSGLSLFRVGELFYAGGPNLKEDEGQALDWFLKAADKGLPVAMRKVAFCFEFGFGTEKNLDKAIQWYHKAADVGDTAAMLSLGSISEFEQKDLAQAKRWREKAAELESDSARFEHGTQFLVIGAGVDAEATNISTERDLAYLAERAAPSIPVETLFCDGNVESKVVSVKEKMTADQQCVANVFLLKDRKRMSTTYRTPHLPNGFGPATESGLNQALSNIAGRMAQGDRLVVCVAGHGSRGSGRLHNTGFSLWGEPSIVVDDFASVFATPVRRGNLVLVMNQCFGGGFADLIFEPSDDSKPAERHLCGFFAAPADEMAAGCTSNPDSSAFRDYSSYFFAALFGVDIDGKSVALEEVDFNHDGTVSLREAHAFALLHDDSMDLPVTTSDVFLRRFSRKRDLRDATLVPPSVPRQKLLESATPDQVAVIAGLLTQLNLPGRNVELEAVDYQDSVAKKIRDEYEAAGQILEELKKIQSTVQSDISREAFAPLQTDIPPAEKVIENLLLDPARTKSVAMAIRNHKSYGRLEELLGRLDTEIEKIDRLKCDGTKARRLSYVVDSVILHANLEKVLALDHVNDETTQHLYKNRFDDLLAAENESLKEATRR